MKLKLTMLLCACAYMALAATPQDEVKSTFEQWRTAVIQKDKATLEKLVADDVTYSHSSALMENKKQMIDAILAPGMVYHSLDVADTQYRVFGNTALMQTKMTVTNTQKGEKKVLPLSVLMVWVKDKGQWRMVARQSTRIT